MKTIKQIREDTSLITVDDQRLRSLVEAGLLNNSKANLLENALNKDSRVMTPMERNLIVDLVESMISEIAAVPVTKPGTVSSAPKNNPFVSDKRLTTPSGTQIPQVIMLRRKSIRTYPDDQTVALYYAPAIDKYISIPFSKDINVAAINEVSTFVPPAKKEIDPNAGKTGDERNYDSQYKSNVQGAEDRAKIKAAGTANYGQHFQHNEPARKREELSTKRDNNDHANKQDKPRDNKSLSYYLAKGAAAVAPEATKKAANAVVAAGSAFHNAKKDASGGALDAEGDRAKGDAKRYGTSAKVEKAVNDDRAERARKASPTAADYGARAGEAAGHAATAGALLLGRVVKKFFGDDDDKRKTSSDKTDADTSPNAKPKTNDFDSKSNRGNIDKIRDQQAQRRDISLTRAATRVKNGERLKASMRNSIAKRQFNSTVKSRMAQQAFNTNVPKSINEELVLDGKTFHINTSIKNKITEVFNSLNLKNRKLMIAMMEEDMDKVIDFVKRN